MDAPNLDQIPDKLKDLVTPELLEQAKQCKTEQEALDLLNNSGVEIPDEVLDTVAGGYWGCSSGCDCDWFHF